MGGLAEDLSRDATVEGKLFLFKVLVQVYWSKFILYLFKASRVFKAGIDFPWSISFLQSFLNYIFLRIGVCFLLRWVSIQPLMSHSTTFLTGVGSTKEGRRGERCIQIITLIINWDSDDNQTYVSAIRKDKNCGDTTPVIWVASWSGGQKVCKMRITQSNP